MENGATVRNLKILICIALLSLGSKIITTKLLASILGITRKTAEKYRKYYESKEIEKVLEYEPNKRKSELVKFEEEIERELTANPCQTLKEVQQRIFELTKIKRGLTQTWNFVRALGFKPLKIGNIPCKADLEVQKEYAENELKPILEEAKQGKAKVFFVDSAHFVMGQAFGQIWTKMKMFIKSSSGRQRYNVLGALDFITKKVTTVTNEKYITATQVVELIDKLVKENTGHILYLVMDNASYQRCKLVTEFAKSNGVILKFIPPYSPNLNLIERFWKYVKKEALAVNYFLTFEEYKRKIDQTINESDKSRKSDMDKLITDKFQLFDEKYILKLIA